MSFDLAVWSGPAGISDEDALRKYMELTDALIPVAMPGGPDVAAFYRELTSQLPELTVDMDRSPCSAGVELDRRRLRHADQAGGTRRH